MENFFAKKQGNQSKQTGLFGQAPKVAKAVEEPEAAQNDQDMDIDEQMLKKVNEMPKFVPWVEKQ